MTSALGPIADYDDLYGAGRYPGGDRQEDEPLPTEPPPDEDDYGCDQSDQSGQSPSRGHLSSHPSLRSQVAAWDDSPPWPDATPEMFHGPLGAFALEAAEHTEAGAVAVLAHCLAYFGAIVGRGPHVLAGNSRHGTAFFEVVVGDSAAGGKGTADSCSRPLFDLLDPSFCSARILGGFGSGEAVVAKLTPPEDGPHDHRLLVLEPEWSAVLARNAREGSTMSQTLREGWDGKPIANRTRSGGELVARDYHLAVIGHVVAEELILSTGDAFGGFANRVLHFCVRRGVLRPDGGNVPDDVFAKYARQLAPALRNARTLGEVHRTDAAARVWRPLYYALADDRPPGLLGKVTARSAAQCLRLSLLFALADGAIAIDAEHVVAAAAVWDYCRASAAYVFGDSTGNGDADRLLTALRIAGAEGLDLTAQRDLFGRHPGRSDKARSVLERLGLAVTESVPTTGRPRHVTRATEATEATKALSSLPSLRSQVADNERTPE